MTHFQAAWSMGICRCLEAQCPHYQVPSHRIGPKHDGMEKIVLCHHCRQQGGHGDQGKYCNQSGDNLHPHAGYIAGHLAAGGLGPSPPGYLKTRRGSPYDLRPSTAEAPQIGKIHPFNKIALTLDPEMQFGCPSRFRTSKHFLHSLFYD